MKKIIVPIICLILIILTIIFLSPISNKLSTFITDEKTLTFFPRSTYAKNANYEYVKLNDSFIPYSYQDLLDIYYTVINNGWDQFTFYCPNEYKDCIKDAKEISDDDLILTHLNNYIHPFNSFTNIKTTMKESGEITIFTYYLYNDEEINKINAKVDEIIKNNLTEEMDDYERIKTIHDYIINNTKYDIERNEGTSTKYKSFKAYGPLFEGYATCNGYTDLMAIFLTKLGYDNYKIATTPGEISYNTTGHIWNAVNINGEWLHLDLTWDDPVSSDGKDYLFHNYFLVTTEEMHQADQGKTIIEEHNFNKLYYLEFNK